MGSRLSTESVHGLARMTKTRLALSVIAAIACSHSKLLRVQELAEQAFVPVE
jgi:hypothetical protein